MAICARASIAAITFLSERGLAFRGDDELIDSPRNGNFLGTLELIAQFDPFLAGHLEKQRTFQEEGRGRGTVSYLSSTICDELIKQMGSQVMSIIADEIKAAKYYSISIDSIRQMLPGSTASPALFDACQSVARSLWSGS